MEVHALQNELTKKDDELKALRMELANAVAKVKESWNWCRTAWNISQSSL